jgi:DNA polymerase-3 subunit gamma/tau
MAYTVLARKYRSQSFDDVIGQDPIAQTLKNAIKTDRVAHAYLFTGTRGVGKTTMARILAKALNCLEADKPTIDPCCKCDSCVNVNLGEDIDVIEIDGASNNGVEEVRRLRENAIYRPARARFKIYIIDEVHMLSPSAFNALLKILEEPPSHVKFIFATTEPGKVIPTVQSRCQRFDFRNITPALIAEQLKSILKMEKIKYEEDLILPIAKMANGSMRDGLSLLDRLISTGVEPLSTKMLEEYLGCPNSEKVHNLLSKIADSDASGTLAAIDELVNSGLNEVQIADALVDYMRDLMLVKTAADSQTLILSSQQKELATALAGRFDIAALVYNITALEKLRWSLKNSDTARALLDAAMLRLALSEHFINIDSLISQPHQPAVKKKQLTDLDKPAKPASPPLGSPATPADAPMPGNPNSIKSNWQGILKIIADKLGQGTAGLLAAAQPASERDGVITLMFPSSCQMNKKMCESNGRLEQIQTLLADYCKKPVTVKLELSDSIVHQPAPAAGAPGTASRRQNELINDPAVKTVLLGLDATITGIDDE